jgi:hypothetical protein
MSVTFFKVSLPIFLRDCGGSASYNDPFAPLIKDLRHARLQPRSVQSSVEADAHVAGRELRALSPKPPGNAISLIVER